MQERFKSMASGNRAEFSRFLSILSVHEKWPVNNFMSTRSALYLEDLYDNA